MFRNVTFGIAASILAMQFVSPAFAVDSKRESLLVTPEQLQKQIDSGAAVRILDTRDEASYKQGHIYGALHIDMAAWKALSSKTDKLVDPKTWEGPIANLVLKPETQVVIYGEALPESARLWWLLKFLGVNDVRLLDGGWKAWQAAGGKTIAHVIIPEEETELFQIKIDRKRLATLDELLKTGVDEKSACILDNRSDGEYAGTSGPSEKKGHIPGANHLDWTKLVDADGKFKSDDELRKLIAATELSTEKPVITHCQTGGRSSVGAFVLELLGFQDVRNYYAGWSQYSSQANTPIEK